MPPSHSKKVSKLSPVILKLYLVPPINRKWGQGDRVLTKQAQWVWIDVAIRDILARCPAGQQSKRQNAASELNCCRDVCTFTQPAFDFMTPPLGCQIQTAHGPLAPMPLLA